MTPAAIRLAIRAYLVATVARVRVLRVCLVLQLMAITVVAGPVSRSLAAEWPTAQQFLLVEPPVFLQCFPLRSSVAEAADGSLLVLASWGACDRRQRLLRIAPDGARNFVAPFGQVDPGSGRRVKVEDAFAPLPDGSILFARAGAIDRRRPDGALVRVAGTGHPGFSGDGGPATAAKVSFPRGLTELTDGSMLFADWGNRRVRRIAPDGTITTVAGTGETGFRGDSGAATAADLSARDVLSTHDGGFLIADNENGRIRRVNRDGVISTVAGTGPTEDSFGDGGSATAAGLHEPQHLGQLPDGSLVIGEPYRIRHVSGDGTISTIFTVPERHGDRLGDFAGRYGDFIEAMAVTKEGGIAVVLTGARLRALYLAPPETQRALVALRNTRASQRRVKVTVDATTAGRLQLEVSRRGSVVARVARNVTAGRHAIAVRHGFARAYHRAHVILRANRGGTYRDRVRLFTSQTLPDRLVIPRLRELDECRRHGSRRIDCQTYNYDDANCFYMNAHRLFPSGVVFRRPYGVPQRKNGPGCHRGPIRFDRSPDWTEPWSAWPPS